MEALADADIVLVVRDASRASTPLSAERQQDEQLLQLVVDRQAIVVWNKIDVATNRQPDAEGSNAVKTSALTGAGIDDLRAGILALVGGGASTQRESGFLTNARQKQLVTDAIAALERAAGAVPIHIPHEMVLLDLYSALRPLDDITGATTADDILNLIFSSFCIGK
jgi:tRNA modification GTPase